MNESLLDKLKSLGLQQGARNLPVPQSVKVLDISKFVQGRDRINSYGNTFIAEEKFSTQYFHGTTPLGTEFDSSIIHRWAGIDGEEFARLGDYLFLDTETSGLAGGTGTFAFMIGLGFFNQDNFELYQLFLRDPSQETTMLSHLIEIVSPFKYIVTYNGKSFDIPLLNGRFILSSLTTPFMGMQHIDLLHLTRGIWKNRLDNRSLGNIEAEILGVTRGEEEIPGWMVPEMYYDYLKSGDPSPLRGVFYHNKYDILSLAVLLIHLGNLLAHPLQYSADQSLDLIAIARLYEKLENIPGAVSLYEHSLAKGLPKPFYIQTLERYADIAKRKADFSLAVSLWENAANQGSVNACIELAKYYEHNLKNYQKAVLWAEKAQMNILGNAFPDLQKKPMLVELSHRLQRLTKKQELRNAAE